MKKSRTTAALLAFFLGSFGVDRFYLGQAMKGVFLVLLTMIGFKLFGLPIAALIGFIHALRLLSTQDKDFDQKFNQGYERRMQSRRESGQYSTNRPRTSRVEKDMKVQRDRSNYSRKQKSRANPFIKSGQNKYKEYDLEGAAEDFEQALELSPGNRGLHFNMAAVYSLMEKKDKSFYHLEQAVKLGFKDFEKIQSHDDLAFLRIQPEFDSFKSNGYTIKDVAGIAPPKQDLLQDDRLLTQLNKLKDLRDRGLLSEKEFVYEKEKLSRR